MDKINKIEYYYIKQFIGLHDILYQLTTRHVGDTNTATMYSGYDIIFVYRATIACITTTA